MEESYVMNSLMGKELIINCCFMGSFPVLEQGKEQLHWKITFYFHFTSKQYFCSFHNLFEIGQ